MAALSAAQLALSSSIVSDKGHRSHSNGRTIVEFWVQQPCTNNYGDTECDSGPVAAWSDELDSSQSEVQVQPDLPSDGLHCGALLRPSGKSLPLEPMREEIEEVRHELAEQVGVGVPESISGDVIIIIDWVSQAVAENPTMAECIDLVEHCTELRDSTLLILSGSREHVSRRLNEHCLTIIESRDALIGKFRAALGASRSK